LPSEGQALRTFLKTLLLLSFKVKGFTKVRMENIGHFYCYEESSAKSGATALTYPEYVGRNEKMVVVLVSQ